MSIRLRNGKYVVDYYPNGRAGRRHVFTLPEGTTEEQAKEIENERKALKNNYHIASPSGNVKQLLARYLEHCELHQSLDTARDKKSTFNSHIIPFFGYMHIPEITNALLTVYKQQMKTKTYRDKQITNRTISKGLNYFSAFFKWADEELDVRPPLPLHFRRLPHTRPMPIVLSLEEAMAFINAADKQCRLAPLCSGNPKCTFKVAYNIMFKAFFYLGFRNRAMRHLRWEDIDWSRHAVKTVEKGNKVKWHPIPDDLHEELRLLYVGSSSEWIFPSPQDTTKPINNVKKAVDRAKEAAKIKKRVYPHLLRHSIGTHLVDSDVDIRQIQAFLGHSHISTTEWYTQVSMEKKRQALEKAGIKTTKM